MCSTRRVTKAPARPTVVINHMVERGSDRRSAVVRVRRPVRPDAARPGGPADRQGCHGRPGDRSRDAQRRPVHLEAEVFDLMTKWIEGYCQRAEERFERLDAV